jgi:2-haloacid dehalogenase
MAYQWLFFDADGTVFDYDLAEQKALQGAFHDFGLDFMPEWARRYREINRQIWIDFEKKRITAVQLRTERFRRLFESIGVETDTALFSRRYLKNLANASDLIDGAEDTLRTLHQRYRLGLITNGLQDVQRPRLAGSPLGSLFDLVVISEEIGAAKPDPRFFEYAFLQIGSPPRDAVLVIGDSLTSDIQGGINYELDTCWVNPFGCPADPGIRPTFEVRGLPELVGLLG